jgi:hypothetical protein
MAIEKERVAEIRTRYEALAPVMDERRTRLWAAAEAKALGARWSRRGNESDGHPQHADLHREARADGDRSRATPAARAGAARSTPGRRAQTAVGKRPYAARGLGFLGRSGDARRP